MHGAGCGHSAAPVQRSSVPEALRAPGRPLDAAVRTDMEARLGADFSDVRLHTGPTAQRSAAEIGARAYTSGSHVVLGAGGADRHTLAHELTHVIQQRQGPVAGTDRGDGLALSSPDDRFEKAAEENATRVLRDMPAGDRGGPGNTATAQQPAASPSLSSAPPVQRTLIWSKAGVNRTIRTLDEAAVIKDQKGKPANSPEFYGGSEMTWKKLLLGRPRDPKQKQLFRETMLNRLQQLIDDPDREVVLKNADKLQPELRAYDAQQKKDEADERLAAQVAAAPPVVEAAPVAGTSTSTPEIEAEVASLPEAAKKHFRTLRTSGRVFPQEALLRVARKASGTGEGQLFELQQAVAELNANPTGFIQMGPLSERAIESYLHGKLRAYEKLVAGPIAADLVVWKPVVQRENGSAEYGADFVQLKDIKFTSLKNEIAGAVNQLEGMNKSGLGARRDDRETTLLGDDYRGVIKIKLWDEIRNVRDIQSAAEAALRKSKYVHRVEIYDPSGQLAYEYDKPPGTVRRPAAALPTFGQGSGSGAGSVSAAASGSGSRGW